MNYTNLGRTGVQVSRICLGCMSYGSPKWRPWVLEEQEALPFFRKAIELGVNFFDTADMYSLGASEEITGKAMREFGRREEVFLATKVYFPMGDGPNMRGLSRKHIVQACEASLARLGVDTIDLYQIHRFDDRTPLEETLSALDLLIRQGKVRYIGCSSGPAWKFGKSLSLSDRYGWARFISMQNHYNLIYREEEREMNPLCAEESVAVLPWSPLARGLLAGTRRSLQDRSSTVRSGSDDYAEKLYDTSTDWKIVEAVMEVAKERGVSAAQVAIAWLLSKPMVVAPIIGATKIQHLEESIASVEVELSPVEIERLEKHYEPHEVRGY